jgi:hypothetical protein
MAVFLNRQARFALLGMGHKYHQEPVKGGKGDLARLQSFGSLTGKAARFLKNSHRQDSSNQRVSTTLNLNGDSACRVNGLGLPPV